MLIIEKNKEEVLGEVAFIGSPVSICLPNGEVRQILENKDNQFFIVSKPYLFVKTNISKPELWYDLFRKNDNHIEIWTF